MECSQSACQRRQDRIPTSAYTFTSDRDTIRVPAETRNVLFDPSQGYPLVMVTVVASKTCVA